MAQKAEKVLPKILNEWLCNFFQKSVSSKYLEKRSGMRIRKRFPFESSFWISVSGCKLTILSDIQPANRIVIISAAEVAGVTFSDSDSATVAKFLNPGPAILQIWESDSCWDSGCNHPSNRNSHMILPKKWPHRFLLLPKLKIDPGSRSCFSQILDCGSGSERKTQNLAGVDSVRKLLKKTVATDTPVDLEIWKLARMPPVT